LEALENADFAIAQSNALVIIKYLISDHEIHLHPINWNHRPSANFTIIYINSSSPLVEAAKDELTLY